MRPGHLWQLKVCGSTASSNLQAGEPACQPAWRGSLGLGPASADGQPALVLGRALSPSSALVSVPQGSRLEAILGSVAFDAVEESSEERDDPGAALSHHPEPGVLNYGLVDLFAAGTRRALECGLSVRYDHDIRSARDDRKDGGCVTVPRGEGRERGKKPQ
ncbi:hypothetical protein CSAL01_09979 [Colletotrichum salicis]|uniref:Uncharacterized protein n=1 Tax=Colletotrichum salicis TaxID=1209931 RepID=A0A135U426_9PEZI|nr:hypothetical protein CSAL01_09979 [Colletotrichum salicis]